MSRAAAGAYLRVLREARKASRVDVAVEVQTNESQIVRLEQGEVETRATLLLAVTRIVGGSVEEVTTLLLDPDLSVKDGQQWATQRLERQQQAHPAAQASDIALLTQALGHDRRLDLWIGYGYRLLEE